MNASQKSRMMGLVSGPVGLVRKLDTLVLVTLMLAIFALNNSSDTPLVGLGVVIAVTSLIVVRLVIEHRSGVTIPARGSSPVEWLLVAAVPACVWWFVPRGTMVSTVAIVLVGMALAMGAVQFFRERSARRERTIRPT